MKVDISIIIVAFGTSDFLYSCLKSIGINKNLSIEIIVVDNNNTNSLEKELKKRFPKVKYIKSKKNLGFGGGNNLGASISSGKYLFFLNPDTKVLDDSIQVLYFFIKKNEKVGIVAPILLKDDLSFYDPQGGTELTPLSAIFSLSFVNKIFPNNPISKKYFLKDWRYDKLKEVDVCPGTAFMISKKLFDQIGGFDEKFFLYFEEHDICKSVRKKGFKVFIEPKAKVIHELGVSTRQYKDSNKEFKKSRFTYFRKYFGFVNAVLVESILRINKYTLIISFAVIAGLILRFYNLTSNMSFIGDQGWFYLSARDLILGTNFPLVGITSSHTWLHQGPLWTYLLSIALSIGKFNPIYGAYFTAILGTLSILLIYKVASELFSIKAGVIAAVLYAVSPLIIEFERTPFDTAPIAFFTVFYLFVLYKWINGSRIYFPLVLFTIAVLYNLELATFVLFFPFALLFLFGLIKKKQFVTSLKNRKTFIYSFIAIIIPMLPIIIYDIQNGFKQTVVFLGWTIYKPFASFFGNSSNGNLGETISFLFRSVQTILIQHSFYLSILLFVFSIGLLIYQSFKDKLDITKPNSILLILLSFSFVGILLNKTPSGAYLPILFPFVIISSSMFISKLLEIRYLKYSVIVVLLIVLVLNFSSSINISKYDNFKKRIDATDKIIALSGNDRYNLIGQGPGSQFRSFTMNYEYLLWWKGRSVSENSEKLKIYILEIGNKIEVYKKT